MKSYIVTVTVSNTGNVQADAAVVRAVGRRHPFHSLSR